MNRGALVAACLLSWRSAFAQNGPGDTTVFADVSVLPMTSPVVLTHRNVIVAGDRVVRVDSGGMPESRAGTRIIDGRGRFLVPGLTDAHVHLEFNERRWMPLFLAYGVTTVFNMRGEERHLALRSDIANARIVGPTVYTAGAYVNEPFVQSTSDVSRVATEQKRAGYDFIKIHGNLSADAFRTLTNAGRSLGIAIVGHAPRNLPFDSVIANRQVMIAHAEELLYTHFVKPDTTGVDALGERMRNAKIWLTPNLVAYTLIARQVGRPAVIDSMLALDDAQYLQPGLIAYWRSGTYTNRPLETAPSYETNRRFLGAVTVALFRRGVPMLAGTDTPLPGLYPGRSLHDELDLMVDAGLSPYEALSTATVSPGRFIQSEVHPDVHFGTIEPGMRADLVLVDANPFDGLATLRSPIGVMTAGRWYSKSELRRMAADAIR